MAINVSTLVPASEKAKNVATETYVDSAVAAVDVSGDIADNNEVLAQKLGYASYDAMVAAATSGNTVINGGYINTGLINASAITANQINTTGLIADNISATDIIGKNIYGAYIEGARINGAIIKASYLDLDGDLEVLTDYHIPVATYNASPSSYTDAIYIEADNEYRIPTISNIIETTKNVTVSSGSSISSSLWGYNKGNANTNLKVRKANPQVTVSSDIPLLSVNEMLRPTKTAKFGLYVAGMYKEIVITSGVSGSSYSTTCKTMGIGTVTVGGVTILNNPAFNSSGSVSYDFVINGITFTLSAIYNYSCSSRSDTIVQYDMSTRYYIYIKNGVYNVATSYVNTSVPLIYLVNTVYVDMTGLYSLNNNLSINNMI